MTQIKNKNNKMVLFTHDDLDGVGCKIIFDTFAHITGHPEAFTSSCNAIRDIDKNVLEFINNPNDFREVKRELIIFADICPSADVLKQVVAEGYDVVIFDHHPTNSYALDIIPGVVTSSINDKLVSGTSLLFDDLKTLISESFGDQMATKFKHLFYAFVDLVRSYDTYEWKSTGNLKAKELQVLLFLQGLDRFAEYYTQKAIKAFGNDEPLLIMSDEFKIFVDAYLQKEKDTIDKFIEEKPIFDVEIGKYHVAYYMGAINANIGEVAFKFLDVYPEYDFMVFYFPQNNSIGVRGKREDINLGEEICVPLGGGGHPKAAGAEMDKALQMKLVETVTSFINEKLK